MQYFRASILDFVDDPGQDKETSYRYFEDGLLVVENGLIVACANYASLKKTVADDTDIVDYSGRLILPGFIDTHVHYPQTDIIASHSAGLLDWLQQYTFQAENRFSDSGIAAETAEFFIRELIRNGTTAAMVYATIHVQSVDAIFEAALKQNMRLISGKLMMDRNAPEYLCDSAQSSYDDSQQLIHQWHKHERLLYAVTPRFAPTSTEQQLKVAQQLVNEFPDVYLQSHVAENKREVEWVARLFPWSRSYLDVYDHFGLLGDRSVYAHCIYLDEGDRDCMAKAGATVSFCPTSNLFLGSGLFDMRSTLDHGLCAGIGTDIGAGTSFNILQTLADGYKVCQMKGYNLSSFHAFYMATLGGARCLSLDKSLGNFDQGKEADFIVVDLSTTALMRRRLSHVENIEDVLFVLMILGDDRNILATHIMGKCRYRRDD